MGCTSGNSETGPDERAKGSQADWRGILVFGIVTFGQWPYVELNFQVCLWYSIRRRALCYAMRPDPDPVCYISAAQFKADMFSVFEFNVFQGLFCCGTSLNRCAGDERGAQVMRGVRRRESKRGAWPWLRQC